MKGRGKGTGIQTLQKSLLLTRDIGIFESMVLKE